MNKKIIIKINKTILRQIAAIDIYLMTYLLSENKNNPEYLIIELMTLKIL